MNVACITNDVCKNIIVADSVSVALELLGSKYEIIIECPDNGKIGDLYYNDNWVPISMNELSISDDEILCPICSTSNNIFSDTCSNCGFNFSKIREDF